MNIVNIALQRRALAISFVLFYFLNLEHSEHYEHCISPQNPRLPLDF